MALAPGVWLGPYEVTAQIGVGGMVEVYRARDTKLDRDVAIKVLPESLAGVIAVLLLVGSGVIAQACWTTDTGGGVNFAEGGNGRGLDTELLWRSGLIGGRR